MKTRFSISGAWAGAKAAAVLSPAMIVFGCTFGMIAATTGLSLSEAALMSALVCAGTAQFAALQIWSDPASWVAVGAASLAMNSRYILLGATLRRWFSGLSVWKAYASLYFLYDGNWATATRDHAAGKMDAAHLIGGGLFMCGMWVAATIVGHKFGGLFGDPKRYGLDFVITAFFATMALGFWRGRSDLAPIVAAVLAAVAVDRLVPGPWYILAGAVAGCALAAIRFAPSIEGSRDAS
jgi:predicted branched-subunit amino acid permease